MSSRLFTEIREKRGLAYYVKTNADVYFDTGSFAVHGGVDVGKIEEAVELTLEEFSKCKRKSGKGRIMEKELRQAKEYLKGLLILDLEGTHEMADLFARRWLLEREILTPKQILKKIDEVVLEDVVEVANILFSPEKLNLAVVGPYEVGKYGQKFGKMLKM